MGVGTDGWLTLEAAAERWPGTSGSSVASLRRWALTATHNDPPDAIKAPRRDGLTKDRWLLRPEAVARMVQSRPVRPIRTTEPRRGEISVLAARMTAIETTLSAILERIDGLVPSSTALAAAEDDARSARTVALVEKGVSDALQATVTAQQQAAEQAEEGAALQAAATERYRAAAATRQEAASRLAEAVGLRADQLREFLAPGSTASLYTATAVIRGLRADPDASTRGQRRHRADGGEPCDAQGECGRRPTA